MSIQNRLLIIYTFIFTAAFLLMTALVYFLPREMVLNRTDAELENIAQQIRADITSSTDMARLEVPPDLASFKTASTFMQAISLNGTVAAQSDNLSGFTQLLDPAALGSIERQSNLVTYNGAALRVLTVPVILSTSDGKQQAVGYVQVARLLDSFDEFNRVLTTAMLIGFGAASASLFLAVWLTPSLFKPLEDIATVARQITKADDLSRRVPDTGRLDEIGDLARAFNQTLERLERLFQTQQRLLADVSHELRTPLTSIQGNLDLMRHMGVADPESMDVIQDEIERMTRLIGNLLLLARADAGGIPLERKPVELDNILFEVYRQVARVAGEVEVKVVEVDQVCVLGDKDRLKQLILILVDNAIKYTSAGGCVNLSLSRNKGWAQLDVADTGVGIPAKDIPYIFERFYRVDKARTRTKGGSGLGLAIAKWIARAHGGSISVKSTVGEGATFSIILPAYKRLHPENFQLNGQETQEKQPNGKPVSVD